MLADHNDNNKIDIDFIKNKHGFTNRHIDVIACLTRGKFSNKTIAQVLKVSPKTVDSHIQMVMQKLGINIREKIIEFMQTSGYENALKEHYHILIGFPQQDNDITPFQVGVTRKIKNKNKFILVSVIFISLIMINFAKRFYGVKMFFHNITLHPNTQYFLERHHIIQEMYKTLIKQNQSVKIIAISGIGGAGKTTLARQYTKRYPSSVVWEINAETPETISNSLFELADQLTKTEEEKNTLTHIKNINDQKERDAAILQFVKNKLRSQKNWLLIYDNVDSTTQIPTYENCGHGTIILTTRDANLAVTNDIISINTLSDEEVFNLFKKITPVLPDRKKEVLTFLKNIPPFPFDVATAAFYIKATRITYPNFIKHMKEHDPTFENTVLKVRKSLNDYAYTRYGLLSLKFRSLMKEHPEFKELLLALALFDSQRTPRAFLDHCKKRAIVDLFIHALQKYSLITACDSNSISLHRSTQEHLIRFLTEELKDIQTYTDVLMNILKKYLKSPIQKIDTDILRSFIPHLHSFLKHEKLLTPQSQLTLRLLLGQIYFSFDDYPESKKYLEDALRIHMISPQKTTTYLKAELLSYLGALYKSTCDYTNAKKFFTEALSLYENSKDQDLEKAFLLVNFGHYRVFIGDDQTPEMLKKGIDIYKQKLGDNHPQLAMCYICLGNVYEWQANYPLAHTNYELAYIICNKIYGPTHTTTAWTQLQLGRVYNNLGKYSTAIKLIKKNTYIYEKFLFWQKDTWSWNLIYLGDIYLNSGMSHLAEDTINKGYRIKVELNGTIQMAWSKVYLAQLEINKGQYQKAVTLLEGSLSTYESNYPNKNHTRFAWICHHLGNAYKLAGDYSKALKSYTRSLDICKEKYGEQNIEIAMVMTDFGDLYRYTNQLEQSESMLNNALAIFEKSKHPQAYKCLEYLGDLRMTQSKPKEAKSYYKKALEIAKANFPKGSDYTKRLQQKLSS